MIFLVFFLAPPGLAVPQSDSCACFSARIRRRSAIVRWSSHTSVCSTGRGKWVQRFSVCMESGGSPGRECCSLVFPGVRPSNRTVRQDPFPSPLPRTHTFHQLGEGAAPALGHRRRKDCLRQVQLPVGGNHFKHLCRVHARQEDDPPPFSAPAAPGAQQQQHHQLMELQRRAGGREPRATGSLATALRRSAGAALGAVPGRRGRRRAGGIPGTGGAGGGQLCGGVPPAAGGTCMILSASACAIWGGASLHES